MGGIGHQHPHPSVLVALSAGPMTLALWKGRRIAPTLHNKVALGYVQYVADMTITVASSSHETIKPANIVQPRAFVIAEAVTGLFTVASACIRSSPVRAGVPS
jgi:hypothetical protein